MSTSLIPGYPADRNSCSVGTGDPHCSKEQGGGIVLLDEPTSSVDEERIWSFGGSYGRSFPVYYCHCEPSSGDR